MTIKFRVLADDAEVCDLLAARVGEALTRLDLDFPVVTDASPGRAAAIDAETPVILENNLIISSGKILSADEIAALIRSIHAGDLDKLKKMSARGKKFARLKKNALLLGAVLCAVFAVLSGLRTGREITAQETGRPLSLRFYSPLKIYYFHREPYSKADKEQEIILRRTAFKVFHEEALHNLVVILPMDAAQPESARLMKDFGVKTVPAVVLQKNGKTRISDCLKQKNPAVSLLQSVNELQ